MESKTRLSRRNALSAAGAGLAWLGSTVGLLQQIGLLLSGPMCES